jgi:hypothetical protein
MLESAKDQVLGVDCESCSVVWGKDTEHDLVHMQGPESQENHSKA